MLRRDGDYMTEILHRLSAPSLSQILREQLWRKYLRGGEGLGGTTSSTGALQAQMVRRGQEGTWLGVGARRKSILISGLEMQFDCFLRLFLLLCIQNGLWLTHTHMYTHICTCIYI